jgi:hypothetical protein
MEKEKYIHRTLAVIFFLVVGYYLVGLILPALLPEPKKNIISDAKTGAPLSEEKIAQITKKQVKGRLTYVITGKVANKFNNSLEMEILTGGSARLFLVKFSDKTVFFAETPLLGYEKDSSSVEEKKISLAEVNVGDTVTTVFPKGVALGALNNTEAVLIDNLIVNMPQETVLENE